MRNVFLIFLFALPAYAGDWNYKGTFTVTRYCACEKCCGIYSDGKTATGTPARYGVIAVDPRIIKLGTRVKIDGFDKPFRAEDVGGKIKGNKIDIFHPSHAYGIQWGRQRRGVWIRKTSVGAIAPKDGIQELAGFAHSLVDKVIGVPAFLLLELFS